MSNSTRYRHAEEGNVEVGDYMVTRILKTIKPDIVQLELAENIKLYESRSSNSAVSFTMREDERFQNRLIKQWLSYKVSTLKRDIPSLADAVDKLVAGDKHYVEVGAHNLVAGEKKVEFRLQITEHTEPRTKRQMDSPELECKRAGEGGAYLLDENNQPIFRTIQPVTVLASDVKSHGLAKLVKHELIPHTNTADDWEDVNITQIMASNSSEKPADKKAEKASQEKAEITE